MVVKSIVSRLLAIIAISSLVAACGGVPAGTETTVDPSDTGDSGETGGGGGAVGDFTLKDVDGKSVSLSDFLGEYVIVMSFWATWCEPCKREMIQIDQLYREHNEKGLMYLAISMDEPETVGDVRTYIKQRGYTFPVLLDIESLVTNQFNPKRAAPYTCIISKDQEIIWEHESYVPGDEKLVEAEVLKSLGLKTE